MFCLDLGTQQTFNPSAVRVPKLTNPILVSFFFTSYFLDSKPFGLHTCMNIQVKDHHIAVWAYNCSGAPYLGSLSLVSSCSSGEKNVVN